MVAGRAAPAVAQALSASARLPDIVDSPPEQIQIWKSGQIDQLGPLQGISVGWADSYHQATPLQQLDVTGIPDGYYTLVFVADPHDNWIETHEDNNNSWAELRIYTQGGNRKVEVLGHNPCEQGVTCDLGGNK